MPRTGLMRICWWVDDYMDTWIIDWCTNIIPLSNVANDDVAANTGGTLTIFDLSCAAYYACYKSEFSIGNGSWYESTCFQFLSLLIWQRKTIIIYLMTFLAAMVVHHVINHPVSLITTAVAMIIRAITFTVSSICSAWMYFDFQKCSILTCLLLYNLF